jgi:hypothetical protein
MPTPVPVINAAIVQDYDEANVVIPEHLAHVLVDALIMGWNSIRPDERAALKPIRCALGPLRRPPAGR